MFTTIFRHTQALFLHVLLNVTCNKLKSIQLILLRKLLYANKQKILGTNTKYLIAGEFYNIRGSIDIRI